MSIFVVALICCVVLIFLFRSSAHYLGLLDHPDERKIHHCPIPTVGGVAMFFSVLTALYIGNALSGSTGYLMACAGGLMALGLLDDKHDLPISIRLMIQICLVLVVIQGADAVIVNLGDWFGHDVRLGMVFAVPFSLFAFVGAINAMNMIDGADGMAGSMAMITVLGVISLLIAQPLVGMNLVLPTALLAALAAFLIFNARIFFRRAWIFMGDAGSMWLGLVVAWLLSQIARSGGEPWVVLWIFGLPLIDTLTVMLRRLGRKRSPFVADRTHIHHVLERKGFKIGRAVLLASLMQTALVGVGVVFYLTKMPTVVVFGSFIFLFAAYYYWLRHS